MVFDFEREREQRKQKRIADLCAALTARGVPHMTYDNNPGKVLVNFGQSEGEPFNGLVPCWIDPTDDVVTFDVGGVGQSLRARVATPTGTGGHESFQRRGLVVEHLHQSVRKDSRPCRHLA